MCLGAAIFVGCSCVKNLAISRYIPLFPCGGISMGTETPAIKQRLFGKQRGLYNGCGHHFLYQNFTKDPIVPLAKGGADSDDNLRLLCAHCNALKRARLPMAGLKAILKRKGFLASYIHHVILFSPEKGIIKGMWGTWKHWAELEEQKTAQSLPIFGTRERRTRRVNGIHQTHLQRFVCGTFINLAQGVISAS